MSFIETLRRAKELLREEGRLSLRALKRELGLDDDEIGELTGELLDAQRVAILEGGVLVWVGEGRQPLAPGEPATTPPERDPRDYTPRHLADKILQSKSALEGERKQVTVLFADVKGSMELAEQVDPEEWHRILDRFFQILADGVHRFEGTVNQYTGDGIMALFGAPIAHEDHAQRACYAALHLRQELARHAVEVKREHGLNISVRMGIHSGEVVVGKIGADLRMDYTAQGHTVGLAARMEELASPDTAYLTDATASLVSGYLDLADLGPFELKGVGEPVRVHQLVGMGKLRTRFEVARQRGLTRFVGREDDLQALEAVLAGCHEGNGQVVGVVGEAGVGKSRLCFELAEHCRARGLRVFEGRGVAHGKNLPFLPILQVFRAYYGIADQDDDRTAREKIAGRMLLLDEGFREVLPLLFEFLGVPDPERPAPQMDPEAWQRRLFSVLGRLAQSGRAESPIITLIEDLHWLDGGSEAWIAEWVDAIAGTPGLLLVNFRPEYHADWMKKSYYRQLPLAPLGANAIRSLLDDLLGGDPSIAGLAETIHQRTGGNPFFTEEVVQSLIEAGNLEGTRGDYRLVTPIDELVIPGTVQSMLAARIDRLAEREKQLLQTAAVIGREFGEPILGAVSELPRGDLSEALGSLKASEFIYEQALYPVAEYAFRHPLTQEVALHSQLQERRRRTHAAVARAIEAANPAKLDESAALIAHHLEGAGKALEAAGWHRRAAVWAGDNHPGEALTHWRRVHDLLKSVPESPKVLEVALEATTQLLRQGGRLGLEQEEILTLFSEGRSLCERSDDPGGQAAFLLSANTGLLFSGRVREAREATQDAVRLADSLDNDQLKSAALFATLLQLFFQGRFAETVASCEQAMAFARSADPLGPLEGGWRTEAGVLWLTGSALTMMGRLDEAASTLEQAVARAREANILALLAGAHAASADLAVIRGDPETAMRHGRRAVEIEEEVGSTAGLIMAYTALGGACVGSQRWGDAEAALTRAVSMATERHTGWIFLPATLSALVRAHLGAGDPGAARAVLKQVPQLVGDLDPGASQANTELARAQLLLRVEGRAARVQIDAAIERAAALIQETGARALEPALHEARAELAQFLGDHAARERELREAHRLSVEMGATGHAKRLARELAS
jgi:class 3 adenylate cyclase/tetratricopeptide (TPR) repeat protein